METALIGGLLTVVADLPTNVAVPLAMILGVFGLGVVRYVEYRYHLWHTIPPEMQQERITELERDKGELAEPPVSLGHLITGDEQGYVALGGEVVRVRGEIEVLPAPTLPSVLLVSCHACSVVT